VVVDHGIEVADIEVAPEKNMQITIANYKLDTNLWDCNILCHEFTIMPSHIINCAKSKILFHPLNQPTIRMEIAL